LNLSETTIEKIDEELSRAYEKGMSEDNIKLAVSMMIKRMQFLRETVRNIINLCYGMKKININYILHQIQNDEMIFDQSKKVRLPCDKANAFGVLKIKNLLNGLKSNEIAYVIREINKHI
jgi:Mg2+/Co2+ transporter CorC